MYKGFLSSIFVLSAYPGAPEPAPGTLLGSALQELSPQGGSQTRCDGELAPLRSNPPERILLSNTINIRLFQIT